MTQQQSNYPPPCTAWVDTLPISITICALVLLFTSQPSLSFSVWLMVPSLLLSVAPCPFSVCLSFSVNVCVCLWDHFWRGGLPIPELELSLRTLTSPCAKNTDLDMHCSGKPDPFCQSGPCVCVCVCVTFLPTLTALFHKERQRAMLRSLNEFGGFSLAPLPLSLPPFFPCSVVFGLQPFQTPYGFC